MSKSRGFTLVETLVTVSVLSVMMALLLPAVQSARSAARRASCANNVKQISLAMLSYETSNGRLPPMAVRWEDSDSWRGSSLRSNLVSANRWFNDHGWYTLIGAQIEETGWFNRINFRKSFSDEANLASRKVKISLYGCPEDGLKENEWPHKNWARVRGNYVVNAGNTNYGQTAKDGVAFGGAPFLPRLGAKLASISDGTSKTLMFSETITTLSSEWWGGPISDISISTGGQTFTGWLGPNSATPDSAARECPRPAQYNGIPGCSLTSPDDESSKTGVYAARSKHHGGVTASMCDGSVRFVSDGVDVVGVWRLMTTSRGGETFSEEP